MPVFQIDITDEDGTEYRDEIESLNEKEARITVENLGYTVHQIRVKRLKTLLVGIWYRIDRVIHPRKYHPATAFEYMLEKIRREHPDLDD